MTVAVAQQSTVPSLASSIGSYTLSLTSVGSSSVLIVCHYTACNSSATPGTVSSITASGYSWSKVKGTTFDSGGGQSIDNEVWIGTGGSGGSVTVTVNLNTNNSGNFYGGDLFEITGAPASPIVSSNTVSDRSVGTSRTGSTITPSATGNLSFFFEAEGLSPIVSNPTSPWTTYNKPDFGSPPNYGGAAYQAGVAGVGVAPTWTVPAGGITSVIIGLDIGQASGAVKASSTLLSLGVG